MKVHENERYMKGVCMYDYVCILKYTVDRCFFCIVLKVKASMTGYDHLLQCLFASWFGLAIAYLRGEARPQLAKFAVFLAAFCWGTAWFIVHLDVFFWSPGTTAPEAPAKKPRWNPSGSWRNPGKSRRFYVASLEIWAAWDPSRQTWEDSPGILSKTWIHWPCIISGVIFWCTLYY